MPLLYQHRINNHADLALWKIEEPDSFFTDMLPELTAPSHSNKRSQYLAGRFLLKKLDMDFPIEAIQAKPGEKPFLPGHSFYFSISHSEKIAAAIISTAQPVGIDVEMIRDKALRVAHKFLREEEFTLIQKDDHTQATLLWSIKETVFKWYGLGSVDFREDIQIKRLSFNQDENTAECFFKKTNQVLNVKFFRIGDVMVSWFINNHLPLSPPQRGA